MENAAGILAVTALLQELVSPKTTSGCPRAGTDFLNRHVWSIAMSMTIRENGELPLVAHGQSELVGAVFIEGKDSVPAALRYQGQGVYVAPGIQLDVHAQAVTAGFEITLQLQLESQRHITMCGVELGPLELKFEDEFYGNFSGSFAKLGGILPALAAQAEEEFSTMVAMVVRPGRDACLAGIGGIHADTSHFSLNNDRFRLGFRPERTLVGGHKFKLFMACHPDPLELLQTYGQYLKPWGRVGEIPTGWNSWDFYGGAISMADIEEEINALNQLPFRDHLNYLTIDMGWEEGWGQWIPNRKFPATFERIAAAISATGWRPGIWTAPLQVSRIAPLARQRQDIFLHNAEGNLVVEGNSPIGPVLLLDFSLPEVNELVGKQFAAMRQAGFELFKVDYIYDQYLAHCKDCANHVGKMAFSRQIFQTIRDAVGPQAHIINCGGPKEAALGLVDSSRVTVDIHNFWGHIRNDACQMSRSFWMNHCLWINDPDFALVRHRGNCMARYLNPPYTPAPLLNDTDFWMRGPEASHSEMRLWLSVVRLNGGSIMLSDSLRHLTTEGRCDLAKLFPPLKAPFVPLDLFERKRPGIWLSQDKQRPTVGLFNWEDEPTILELPPQLASPLKAKDFWSGQAVHLSQSVELAPRSGMLLEI